MTSSPLRKLYRRLPARRLKRFLRTAAHARSVRTAYFVHMARGGTADVRLAGLPGSVRMRAGTSDAELVRMLANGYDFPEYRLPVPLTPRTILDLGANVGIATIMLARQFPDARVFAFEPLPDNFAILRHNVSCFPNVTAIPYGLGVRTEERTFYHSVEPTNCAGGGFYFDGSKSFATSGPHSAVETLPVLATTEAMERYGIDQVDLIKIDTEGAEYDILTSLPSELLDTVQVIVGELHGIRNEETLAFLRERFEVSADFPHDQIGFFKAHRATSKSAPSADLRTCGDLA